MSVCEHNNVPTHCAECSNDQNPPSLKRFDKVFHYNTHRQRYGQLFSNMFVLKDDTSLSGLFYETNQWKAREMIRQWLINNQHTQELPPLRCDIYADFLG